MESRENSGTFSGPKDQMTYCLKKGWEKVSKSTQKKENILKCFDQIQKHQCLEKESTILVTTGKRQVFNG